MNLYVDCLVIPVSFHDSVSPSGSLLFQQLFPGCLDSTSTKPTWEKRSREKKKIILSVPAEAWLCSCSPFHKLASL